ncbi:MAG: hypothetical protein GX284_08615 [Clostridiales bacterium]|nr:hypothetical protein [Clostridiales bacterium]
MANQTQILNVSDEMKFDDNVQTDNVKEQEENMYSSSSDTTEELCSFRATDTCGDGLSFVKESPVNQRVAPIWGKKGCVFQFPQKTHAETDLPQG